MPRYDVFLCHNTHDKSAVELIAQRLVSDFQLTVFLDKLPVPAKEGTGLPAKRQPVSWLRSEVRGVSERPRVAWERAFA